ncbi:hypothetical protein H4R34_001074 [Dimargaris verticillata]|uniref:J domain-containing protein n=1 Tax=Dimargaris verticillata TaxID=2761393 RepID=A0A9W8BC29_9FUNG|nr:hypothetical protein H4R34_001074 [Dimargaris verticillata]
MSTSRQDLKSAFYKLSMKYRPDKNPNNDKAHGRFIAINEAYNTLSDDTRRREYDCSLLANYPFRPTSHAATAPSESGFKYHRRPATGSGHWYHPGRKATHCHHYASQDHQTQFDTEYRHHWSDAHLHSASQWYIRTQSWNRGHPPQSDPGRRTNPQAMAENDGTQKAYTGATYTNVDDLPPSDYEIHMSRVRGVTNSMLIWASLLGTVAYALRFYEAHMVTEPRRKHSTTALSSKS